MYNCGNIPIFSVSKSQITFECCMIPFFPSFIHLRKTNNVIIIHSDKTYTPLLHP